MKAMVIYDSNYGNTKKIAEAVASELGKDTKVISVNDFNLKDLKGIDLLVVGSPIVGWNSSEKMSKFLRSIGTGQLRDLKAATFDTRMKIFFHGDASKKMSQELVRAGARIVGESQGFYVHGREGPLFDGEIEKASEWSKLIKTNAKG
jgi:flavodoxin